MNRPDRPAPGVERGVDMPIDTGIVSLRDESDGSTTVLVNRVPSSTLHLSPERLDFEYMRNISAAVAAWQPPEKMIAIHVGGGACTLPRHLAHAYPDSRHIVVEADASLARLAREWWDLPKAPRVKVRTGDGLEALKGRHDDSADLIVRDAFVADRTPGHLAGDEFWAEARRVLRPGGIVAANVVVKPREDGHRADATAAAGCFAETVGVGDAKAASGSRLGNVVVIAGDRVPTSALQRYAASAPLPTVVRRGWVT